MAFRTWTPLFLTLIFAAGASAQAPPVPSSYNLVLVFVDFKDGRTPDGSLPTTDADLKYFNDTTINAVGGMGYININPHDRPVPRSPKRRMIRKYTYDDYWDMYFTVGSYRGKIHPDYSSHGIQVYGSMRDYYNEASYGNVQILPYPTWPGMGDKYHIGIVNHYDESGGKKFIRWIKISATKRSTDYVYPSPEVLDDARSAVRALHALPGDDPEYIPFDIDAYFETSPANKVIFIGAGGAKSGYARGLFAQDIWLTEKPGRRMRSNAFASSTLEGIQGCVHEFAHLLGVEHFLGGSYDPMSWGGVGPDSTYDVYDYCPPHFNPWVKLKMGWIPAGAITRVNGSRLVSLQPISDSPSVALITLYGEAGRGKDYAHSEYLLVEYRKREGFNRFAGGISTPGFDGGALVWHYTNYHPFPVSGQLVEARLGLKLADYGMKLKADPGSPSHFFWKGHAQLGASTMPNSSSAAGRETGITLRRFKVRKGRLEFSVSYSHGGIPRWDTLFSKGQRLPGQLTGKVYAEIIGGSPLSLALEGSDLYLSPGSSITTVLTGRNSKLHLLEDATCTIAGKSVLGERFQVVGTGALAVSAGASLQVESNGRISVGREIALSFAPGAALSLGSQAVLNVRGTLTAPDSIARWITIRSSTRRFLPSAHVSPRSASPPAPQPRSEW